MKEGACGMKCLFRPSNKKKHDWKSILALLLVLTSAARAENLEIINGPMDIEKTVQIALKNNPELSAMEQATAATWAKYKQSKAMLLPSFSFSAFYTDGNNTNIFSTPEPVMPRMLMNVPAERFSDLNLMGMLPLYTGGRLNSMIKGSRANFQRVKEDTRSMKLDVIFMTREAYRRALYYQAQQDVYKEMTATLEEQLRIDKKSFEVGKIPQFYLFRTQAELANARQMLTDATKDFQIAITDLVRAMGVSQQSSLTLTTPLEPEALEETLENLLAEALDTRPEVQAAWQKVVAAKAMVKGANSAYFPQISVMAMQDSMKPENMPSFSGNTVGLVAGFQIYDGGYREEKKKEAKNMLSMTTNEYRAAKLTVEAEVHKVWYEAQAAKQNIFTSEEVLKQAEEDYRVAKLRFEAGKSIQVELLDALTALIRAKSNHIRALYESLTAKDMLMRAVGRET